MTGATSSLVPVIMAVLSKSHSRLRRFFTLSVTFHETAINRREGSTLKPGFHPYYYEQLRARCYVPNLRS